MVPVSASCSADQRFTFTIVARVRALRQIVHIFPSINIHPRQEWNVSRGYILWIDVKILLLLHGYFKVSIITEWMLKGQNSSFSARE